MILRLLTRLIIGLILGRLTTKGRCSRATGNPGARFRRQARSARELIGMVGQALGLIVMLAVAVVLGTAGTTVFTLGPRWFGVVILIGALAALVAAAVEARRLRRGVISRRLHSALSRVADQTTQVPSEPNPPDAPPR